MNAEVRVTALPAPWEYLLHDLAELDEAGALGGICAIVAERVAQVRNGMPGSGLRERVHAAALHEVPAESWPRSYVITAAILAADLDRTEMSVAADRTDA